MAEPDAQLASDEHLPSARRHLILDAAERCFVRAGFHRTTMQDVAAEAGMSPGNLYRYFPSKDAIIAGIVERDRAQIGRDFAKLPAAGDFLASFTQFGRRHFEDRETREKATLCLEIWAEATRNPAVAALNADFKHDVRGRLVGLFAAAKDRGALPAKVDVEAAAGMVVTLVNGLFVRRALGADAEYRRDVAHAFAVIEAILDGRVCLASADATPGGSP